jgi:sulfite reductase (NADPH) flavoprotein alpha-component
LPTKAERASYNRWIDIVADTLGDTHAAVVLQPDGPFLGCVPHGSPVPARLLGHAARTLSAQAHVSVYVEPNERFRLPADGARDIIMIGPGTGVAPFRGFVQERRETGASGRNWLLFGNRHFRSEFLYQAEWQKALRDGSLHRLDLAFSRDAAPRTHVQHKLREHGRALYAWLDDGAHLYVCGDATRMAKDVHATLLDVLVEHGGIDRERAEERLAQLVSEGRYARDVY